MSDELAAHAAAPTSAPRGGPWGLPEALGALALTLFVQIAGVNILAALGTNVLNPSMAVSILLYQFLVLGVLVSAILILARFHVGPEALGYRFPGWDTFLKAAAAVLPIYLGVLLLYALFTTLLPGYHLRGNARDLFQGLPKHPGLGREIVVFLWSAVEAPLTEETLFRGILFQGLRHFLARWMPYQYAVFTGAVLSGTIFGLAHPEPHTWPILIFLGIVLAYVFQFGRSIFASGVVHAIINALATLQWFYGS